MKIEKEHRKSTLMSWTKDALTDYIMCLEHNNNVLHDTIDKQAQNWIQITKDWQPVKDKIKQGETNE